MSKTTKKIYSQPSILWAFQKIGKKNNWYRTFDFIILSFDIFLRFLTCVLIDGIWHIHRFSSWYQVKYFNQKRPDLLSHVLSHTPNKSTKFLGSIVFSFIFYWAKRVFSSIYHVLKWRICSIPVYARNKLTRQWRQLNLRT